MRIILASFCIPNFLALEQTPWHSLFVPTADDSPATKNDLRDLEERMAKQFATQENLADARLELKQEIGELRAENKQEFVDLRSIMLEMFEKHEEQLHHKMMVLNEKLIHDFQGALHDKIDLHHDKIRQHDEEIQSIKIHTGLLT